VVTRSGADEASQFHKLCGNFCAVDFSPMDLSVETGRPHCDFFILEPIVPRNRIGPQPKL
jgi:hypothetical protein